MDKKKNSKNYIRGVIIGHSAGYAFLSHPDGDFFISARDLGGAYHGDEVLAREIHSHGHSRACEVVKIISRGVSEVVGNFVSCKSGGFVIPDDRKFRDDIFIPFRLLGKVQTGDKVIAKITEYPKRGKPFGKITEILGRSHDFSTELLAIEKSFNLPNYFSRKVKEEADSVALEKLTSKKREDFTKDVVITIDGEDAKDFDDAICVKKAGKDFILSVHIADVSHYVKKGSLLDKEAFLRGNSVYFPEKVIPMLPKRLSDDVCSLRQGERRYTLSCIMQVDGLTGDVKSSRIVNGLIKSSARMTYSQVSLILDGDETLKEKYKKVIPLLLDAEALAKVLIEKRKKRGSVDLDVKEAEIRRVDGKITVCERKRTMAHRIIEEFMILANETVANYMFFEKLPCVYRVHEPPAEEKLTAFYDFLRGLGIKPPVDNDFAYLLSTLENKATFPLVNRVMLRAMQKAKYSPVDIGHFGLASEHYCHFTSPIRRYSDLMVHRILKELISHGKKNLHEKFDTDTENASKQASETERNAMLAERSVDDYYTAVYMQGKIGEEMDGIISGVTNFGLFVEVEGVIEGLIRIETLRGGWYDFDERNLTLKNKRQVFRLGQQVKVKVAGVDMAMRRAEFILLG